MHFASEKHVHNNVRFAMQTESVIIFPFVEVAQCFAVYCAGIQPCIQPAGLGAIRKQKNSPGLSGFHMNSNCTGGVFAFLLRYKWKGSSLGVSFLCSFRPENQTGSCVSNVYKSPFKRKYSAEYMNTHWIWTRDKLLKRRVSAWHTACMQVRDFCFHKKPFFHLCRENQSIRYKIVPVDMLRFLIEFLHFNKSCYRHLSAGI